MEKKYKFTFDAENADSLNEKIREFAKENSFEEIARSAPALSCDNGSFLIAVTSTFVKVTNFGNSTKNGAGKAITSNEISEFITRRKKR